MRSQVRALCRASAHIFAAGVAHIVEPGYKRFRIFDGAHEPRPLACRGAGPAGVCGDILLIGDGPRDAVAPGRGRLQARSYTNSIGRIFSPATRLRPCWTLRRLSTPSSAPREVSQTPVPNVGSGAEESVRSAGRMACQKAFWLERRCRTTSVGVRH